MADDLKPPGQPVPSPDLPDAVLAEVQKMAGRLRGVMPSPATAEIDRGDSGRLPPPPSPSNAEGDQSDGVARGRHLGEQTPDASKPVASRPRSNDGVPSVNEILRDPKRFHPPKPPGHGPSRGPRR